MSKYSKFINQIKTAFFDLNNCKNINISYMIDCNDIIFSELLINKFFDDLKIILNEKVIIEKYDNFILLIHFNDNWFSMYYSENSYMYNYPHLWLCYHKNKKDAINFICNLY